MGNPRGRTLPDAMSIYFVMFAVYCIDIFIFQSDLTVFGDAFFARIISFVILGLYLKVSNESVKTLGLSKKGEKFLAGGLCGTLFSVLPFLTIILCEIGYFAATEVSAISFNFETPNVAQEGNAGSINPVTSAVIFVLSCFVGNAFKEIFFRGFMLKRLNKVMSFASANVFQALLYASFMIPVFGRDLLVDGYEGYSLKAVILIFAFSAVYEILSGLKWGLVTRISGSTYIAIVDHFLVALLSGSIFITNGYGKRELVLRMVAIQLVSLMLVLVYYAIGMKKINEKKKREKAKAEAEFNEIRKLREQRKENREVKEKIEGLSEISPANFKNIANEAEKRERMELADEGALENKIVLEDALKEEPVVSGDESVDQFLRKVSKEMRRRENPAKADEITDDFDSDEFLKAYQRQDGSHRNSHKHHHHRHHHHEKNEVKEEAAIVLPKKEKTIAKKPKKTFAQKLQSLGGIDVSSSNDLI